MIQKIKCKHSTKVRITSLSSLIEPDIFLTLLWSFTLLWFVIFQETFVSLEPVFIAHLISFLFFYACCFRLSSLFIGKVRYNNIKLRPFIDKRVIYLLSVLFIMLSFLKLYLVVRSSGITSAIDFRNIATGVEDNEVKRSIYI